MFGYSSCGQFDPRLKLKYGELTGKAQRPCLITEVPEVVNLQLSRSHGDIKEITTNTVLMCSLKEG